MGKFAEFFVILGTMTDTHNGYDDAHINPDTEDYSDDSLYAYSSFAPDAIDYTTDGEYDAEVWLEEEITAEWEITEFSDYQDDDSSLYLPEDPVAPPTQRSFYRTIIALIAILVIAGLVMYWLSPVLNHLLNPPPLPPLPPPWMA